MTNKTRKQAQLEFAQAVRTLVMIQSTPSLHGVCSSGEIESIIIAAENAERGVRERYLIYQRSYGSKRLASVKTVKEKLDELREQMMAEAGAH